MYGNVQSGTIKAISDFTAMSYTLQRGTGKFKRHSDNAHFMV